MLFDNLLIVLYRLRFPENAGMVARACANMGASQLILCSPRNWEALKAFPLATSCGRDVLRNLKISPDLPDALADCHAVYGTSARLGGCHLNMQSPEAASPRILEYLKAGKKVALLFGPEDSGLSKEDIALCTGLIHINTAREAASLNIAQAVLIILYELAKNNNESRKQADKKSSCEINHSELIFLESRLKNALMELHCLSGKNPDHAFRQWRLLLARAHLKRHEYDALLGLCRQITNRIKQNF